jgi:general secretion pathway protein G
MTKCTQVSVESNVRGFTYLELVFVIIILSLLYVFGIDKLLKLRVDAEAAGLSYAISGLRVALSLQMAEMVARGEMHKLPVLVGQNPMDWLLQTPEGYVGKRSPQQASDVEPGQWYFDEARRELVYRVRFVRYFQPDQGDNPEVRLKVGLIYADKDSNGRFDRQKDDVQGVRLQTVNPYRWLDEPKKGFQSTS